MAACFIVRGHGHRPHLVSADPRPPNRKATLTAKPHLPKPQPYACPHRLGQHPEAAPTGPARCAGVQQQAGTPRVICRRRGVTNRPHWMPGVVLHDDLARLRTGPGRGQAPGARPAAPGQAGHQPQGPTQTGRPEHRLPRPGHPADNTGVHSIGLTGPARQTDTARHVRHAHEPRSRGANSSASGQISSAATAADAVPQAGPAKSPTAPYSTGDKAPEPMVPV